MRFNDLDIVCSYLYYGIIHLLYDQAKGSFTSAELDFKVVLVFS